MLRFLAGALGLSSRAGWRTSAGSLLVEVLSFNLDREGVDRPFSVRLMEKTGWSEAVAHQAMSEYLRFIYLAYLASKSGGVAVPSQTVDEVWHLHLQDTQSYWNLLCDGILKKQIHHYPAESSGEDDHYSKQYLETLKCYRDTFKSYPPEEVWGPWPASLGKPKTQTSDSSAAVAADPDAGGGFFAAFFGGCSSSSGGSDGGSSASAGCSSSAASCGGASAGCGGGGCGGGGCGGGGCGGA